MNAPLHREMPGNLLDSARALNDVTQARQRQRRRQRRGHGR